jgi:hypothetical protein
MTGRDLMSYDDLQVKSNDLAHLDVPTVISLAHNEMYFLPAWLDHYRRLGAGRFIILDDASTDGTFEFLRSQPDVMVMGSRRRFGETVTVTDRAVPGGDVTCERRMNHLWRMILAERYCMDRWFVLADLDEFVVLPAGRSLRTTFDALEGALFDAICATMLDVYPRDIAALRAQQAGGALTLASEWFFDAEPHHPAGTTGRADPIHHGARARLVHDFLTLPQEGLARRLLHPLRTWRRARRGQSRYERANMIVKYPLIRWRPGGWMPSMHRVALPVSPAHHLPILHMKFTGDLYRRAQVAIRDKSYHNGSAEYVQMIDLLAAMERRGGSFLYPRSAPIGDIEAFRRAGLLAGF